MQPPNQSLKTPLRKQTKTTKSILKRIKCPNCEYQTNITSHLAKHMKKTHGGSVTRRLSVSSDDAESTSFISKVDCVLCGSGFSSKSEMNNHVKNDHELKCEVCDSTFYDKYDLDMHMNKHITQDKQILQDESIKTLKDE